MSNSAGHFFTEFDSMQLCAILRHFHVMILNLYFLLSEAVAGPEAELLNGKGEQIIMDATVQTVD